VKKFSKLESKDLQAASANRLAFTFINMGEWTDALKELKVAEELEQALDSTSEILSTTYNFKGQCLAKIGGKEEEAKKAFAEALKHALLCGNEPVKEEASKYLEEHGYAGEEMAPDAYI
jgi:tetratricopeptide (TPR) repeat protein